MTILIPDDILRATRMTESDTSPITNLAAIAKNPDRENRGYHQERII